MQPTELIKCCLYVYDFRTGHLLLDKQIEVHPWALYQQSLVYTYI